MSDSTIRARFNVTTRIDRCTDFESSRYALGNLHVMQGAQSDQVYLTACNGRLAAVNLVSGNTNSTKFAPAKIVQTTIAGGYVSQNGKWENERQNKMADNVPQEGRFPRPDYFKHVGDEYRVLRLSAKMLADLLGALEGRSTDDGVTVFVPEDPETEVYMQSAAGFGVIMPKCKDHDDKRPRDQFDSDERESFNRSVSEYRDIFAIRGEVEGGNA